MEWMFTSLRLPNRPNLLLYKRLNNRISFKADLDLLPVDGHPQVSKPRDREARIHPAQTFHDRVEPETVRPLRLRQVPRRVERTGSRRRGRRRERTEAFERAGLERRVAVQAPH